MHTYTSHLLFGTLRLAIAACALAALLLAFPDPAHSAGMTFMPDNDYLADREALERLQKDAFLYMWEDSEPNSGMAYEGTFGWEIRPVAVGGTGFGIASLVVAADRGWITREQAVQRLMQIVTFLRDKTPRDALHGAFPHWIDGATGKAVLFDKGDQDADIVETSLLVQGLLIARAYFNGPGTEETLRDIITKLWEDVDWDWFTNKENKGIYWHWSPEQGFRKGLKILGYNECLITYVLAISSPTHPISRKAYDYWTSGKGYRPKDVYGYRIEASLPGAGPLFLAHYSFIGLDPRRMADAFVPNGYFVRNVQHTLSNRGYCIYYAPAKNRYSEGLWGLTAGQIKDGYAASEPANDKGVITPTAALASMPYTPHYSLQVLNNLYGRLRDKIWGPYGPYDGISLRDDWVSDRYLAIDQLPIVCMTENYRSGLLWRLLMSDPEIRAGLEKAGIAEPEHAEGFPEIVVPLKRDGKRNVPDAVDLRRHPDSGQYQLPFVMTDAGTSVFVITDRDGIERLNMSMEAAKGRNALRFAQFMRPSSEVLTLTMRTERGEYILPLRLR